MRVPVIAALCLLALLLTAAASPSPSPSPSPSGGPNPDPNHHDSIAPGYWLPLLAAPPTPAGYRPGDGLPLSSPVEGFETQPFGCTNVPEEPPRPDCPGGFHTGVDLAAPQGTPVYAAAAGIAYPLPDYQFYGNHVLIQHAGGLATLYAHLVGIGVGWGQSVARGQLIGWVGSTGNSTGPHLHFEVRTTPYYGSGVEPVHYLKEHGVNP